MMEYPTETILSRGLLGFVVFGTAIVIVSADEPVDPNGEVDWIGAYLGVGALILFNFVWKYVFPTRNVPKHQKLIHQQPSTIGWMEQPLRDSPSYPVRNSLCRLRVLGIQGCQGSNTTFQHMESAFVRHSHARHSLLLHELGYLFLVYEHLHANDPRRQPHQSWSPIPALDRRWLCECLLRCMARPPSTGPSHHWHGLPGHGHHQRSPVHDSSTFDLLGHGVSSNVYLSLHDRLNHYQCSNHCKQHRTHEVSRRCGVSGRDVT